MAKAIPTSHKAKQKLAKKTSAKSAESDAGITASVQPAKSTNDTAAKTSTGITLFKRREKPEVLPAKLPNVLEISLKSLKVLWSNKLPFLGIAGIFTLLNIVLVRGTGDSSSLTELKDLVSGTIPGIVGEFSTGVALFAALFVPSKTTTGDSTALMTSLLIVITSLAVIWTLRQVMAGKEVRVRDGFYRGVYPLVPVLLVLVIILLELLPALFAGTVFNAVMSNGVASSAVERVLWAGFLAFFIILTLYLLTASIIALYVATLPDMGPIAAMKSANTLVRWRRWSVMRKLLFVPFVLLVIAAVIMVPVLIVATGIASWVFFALGVLSILVIHSYLFTLYKELLR